MFSVLNFVALSLVALAWFGDYRGGLAGGVYAAGLTYLWVRPGGIGYRIEDAERRREERGEASVRPVWLLKGLAAVVVAVVLFVAAAVVITHYVELAR